MQADPRVGTELAGHRIEAVLGRGSMAIVYLARHLRLGRRVALKVLDPALASDEAFRERFMRGSRAAAALDHPNILPVYDAGEADGVLYLATRFVDGTDLGRVLASEGRLTPGAASTIVTRCAAALDAAHAHGLVHGGLVPAAILLERGWEDGGRIFISDFGITRHVASSTRLTRTGSFAGSVDYVAPEEIRGESDVDGRADVYSLGCVLYHCLTGEVPFPRDSELVTIFAHLEDAPPQASRVRPDLPSAIDPVIERALAKPPQERFSSCLELAEAASLALGSTPATDDSDGGGWGPPSTADEPSIAGPARSKSLRYVGIAVAALLLIVTGVLIGHDGRDDGRSPRPTTDPTGPTTPSSPPPGVEKSKVIAAAGEIACASLPPVDDPDNCRYDATAGLLDVGSLAAVLPLGDNQYESGSFADYELYYDSWWGKARSITQPVPGDREYGQSASADPTGYFEYFGEHVMGPDGFGYYSFNLPVGCTPDDAVCWHFVALNSELCMTSGGCGPVADGAEPGPGNTMYDWLRHDLAAHDNRKYECTLAYWHHPLFTFSAATSRSPEVQPLWDLLYAARADIVLNADAHNYQRWHPMDRAGLVDRNRGIREFVVGTGGTRKDDLLSGTPPAALANAQDTAFGVLMITMGRASFTWEWRSAEGQPPFTDPQSTAASCV